jgi:hypothetical protein
MILILFLVSGRLFIRDDVNFVETFISMVIKNIKNDIF